MNLLLKSIIVNVILFKSIFSKKYLVKLGNNKKRALKQNSGDDYELDPICKITDDCYKNAYLNCTQADLNSGTGCVCKNGKCKITVGCGIKQGFQDHPKCSECDEEDCEDNGLCSWSQGKCVTR